MLKKSFKSVFHFLNDVRLLGVLPAVQGLRAGFGSGQIIIDIGGNQRTHIRRQNSDYMTLRQIFAQREYDTKNPQIETSLLSKYSEILASGQRPLIVDAGANIGLATIWFRSLYPAASIISIEPDPDNFRMLEQNVHADDKSILLRAAVGSAPGFVSLSNSKLGWATQTSRTDDGIGTEIVTLNSVIGSVPNAMPFLIKIDIEGFESDLFAANLEWLDRAFAVFIEPHDWMAPKSNSSRSFQRAFGERDFNLYISGENILFVRN